MVSQRSAQSLSGVIDTESPPKRPRPYRKSRVYTLKRAVRTLGSRTIDRRTRVGKALAAWCDDLARDLGGLDGLSTQQRAIIEQAATTRLLLDSIDAWLVRQPSLVDRRKRALLPVVRERQQLADALIRYLTALGLDRKVQDATDLAAYVAARTPAARAQSAPGHRAVCTAAVVSSAELRLSERAEKAEEGGSEGLSPPPLPSVTAQSESATSRNAEVTP